MELPARGQSFTHIRGLVTKVLLEHADKIKTERHSLAQRDIATMIGADWGMVHISLKSLQEEGAIRIDRHRMIINRELLEKMAEGMVANLPMSQE